MTRATLHGSLTSPYARLCRLVRVRAGAEAAVGFEAADPFSADYRRINPLAKVPALLFADGPACYETTLIARTLMQIGGTDLLPEKDHARLQEEADVALMIGMLDLGVAYLLETRRKEAERSGTWQKRRLSGIEAALPAFGEAANRAQERPGGYAALAMAVTADWLSFRLGGTIDWRTACPAAAPVVDGILAADDLAATDPRNA